MYEVIQGATDESLGKLQTDIDEILNDKTSEQAREEKQREEDANPFSALFSFLSFGKKEEKKIREAMEKS